MILGFRAGEASVAVFLLMLLFSNQGIAQVVNRPGTGSIVEAEEARRTFRHAITYSLNTNLADDSEETLLRQGLRYGGLYSFSEKYYGSFGFGTFVRTVDTSLVEDDAGIFNLSDLSVSIGTAGHSLYRSSHGHVMASGNIGSIFPMSVRSRNEGFQAVPNIGAQLLFLRAPFNVSLSTQYSHILNSYDTNLRGQGNRQSLLMGRIGVSYMYRFFQLRYSYGMGLSTFLGGGQQVGTENSLSLTAAFGGHFWTSVSTGNQNFVDSPFVDLWFYNPFQRVVNFNMGATF